MSLRTEEYFNLMEQPSLKLPQDTQQIQRTKSGFLLAATAGCCSAPLLISGLVSTSTLGIIAIIGLIIYRLLNSKSRE